jgi:hypothetical protein
MKERRIHNVKTRLPLILASLAAIVAAGIWVTPSFLSLRQVTFEKDKGIAEGKAIAVKTRVEGFGVHKGDAIPYSVEVRYNLDLVSSLDKTSLDKSVNFKPFEVRKVADREFELPPRTRVYLREYQIQLIDGKVNNLYKFPSILVRYKSKESGAFEEKAITPDPVFIASRLPADASGFDLKPIQAGIEDANRNDLHRILIALAGLLSILALVDLAWRAIPQWREGTRKRRRAEGVDVLSEAYRFLHDTFAQGAEPRRLFHQMDHILRIVLARKENVSWLEEPDLDRVTPGIKTEVISLFSRHQGVDGNRSGEQKEVQEALGQLDKILKFYWGEGEVRAWRR